MPAEEPGSSQQKPLPPRSSINTAVDHRGNTPLHEICAKADTTAADICRYVAGGADPNAFNNLYLTPLASAIMGGTPETVATLIGLGAEIYMKLPNGKIFNAALMAVHRNDQGILRAIIKAGGGRYVNDSGIGADGTDDGLPCLHVAAQKDKVALIEPLVDAGAHIDMPCGASVAMTPLHYAAQSSWLHAATRLVTCGANLDAQDTTGRTPLYIAADIGRGAVSDHLLAMGADPHIATKTGQTVLMAAAGSGNADLVKILIETYNVDVNAVDANGKTALMCASNKNSVDCIQLLLSAGANPLLTDIFNKNAHAHSGDSTGTYYERVTTREKLKTAEENAAANGFEKKYKKYRP